MQFMTSLSPCIHLRAIANDAFGLGVGFFSCGAPPSLPHDPGNCSDLRASAMLSTPFFSRASASTLSFSRHASTLASKNAKHRIVVVGAGSAGIAVATQLFKAFKSEKRPLQAGDIAIVDPSVLHHCVFDSLTSP